MRTWKNDIPYNGSDNSENHVVSKSMDNYDQWYN